MKMQIQWMDEWIDRQADRRTDGQTDGQTDKYLCLCFVFTPQTKY